MTTVSTKMSIKTERDPLITSMLQEAERLLEDEALLEIFEEPLKIFFGLPQTSEKFIAVDLIGYAAGTTDLLVLLYPGNSLFRLLAALRARNPDFLGIVKDAHVKAPLLVGVDGEQQLDHTNQERAPSMQGESNHE